MSFVNYLIRLLALALLSLPVTVRAALPPEVVHAIAFGDSEEKVDAVNKLVVAGDPAAALPFLQALNDGAVQTADGKRVFIIANGAATDAATGAAVTPAPENLEDVIVNNRVRRDLARAIASLRLFSPEKSVRLEAAKELQSGADETALPLVTKAIEKESDAEVRALLVLTQATLQLQMKDPSVRLAAVKALAVSTNPNTRILLLGVLEKKGGEYVEPDVGVRAEAERSLREVEARLSRGELIGRVFSGISLGSILLLAALGLAITYGLMGVINMAHGELIMIGAYATYVVQNLFRSYLPVAFDWYLCVALPMSFLAAAFVGMALERSVIRHLYGRPLETLLATWGISLILIQTVRSIFGAQNVAVENPAWLSGGVQLLGNLVLPYNRIAIIFFSAIVLLLVWLVLTRTRLGLFVRGVTQNRAMAGCVGVPTARIDTYAFGLGSGLAGLAGCALSQIGNVGPDLGQAYIVDSFMVVVLGGVGQLAGTVYAALGLGIVNKFLEAWSGAVLAKIAVLVFIIVFIQKRPQGLFALKGRAADA